MLCSIAHHWKLCRTTPQQGNYEITLSPCPKTALNGHIRHIKTATFQWPTVINGQGIGSPSDSIYSTTVRVHQQSAMKQTKRPKYLQRARHQWWGQVPQASWSSWAWSARSPVSTACPGWWWGSGLRSSSGGSVSYPPYQSTQDGYVHTIKQKRG